MRYLFILSLFSGCSGISVRVTPAVPEVQLDLVTNQLLTDLVDAHQLSSVQAGKILLDTNYPIIDLTGNPKYEDISANLYVGRVFKSEVRSIRHALGHFLYMWTKLSPLFLGAYAVDPYHDDANWWKVVDGDAQKD